MNEDVSGSSSEEETKVGEKESAQNSWEEDSSSDSSAEEEIEVNDSDSERVKTEKETPEKETPEKETPEKETLEKCEERKESSDHLEPQIVVKDCGANYAKEDGNSSHSESNSSSSDAGVDDKEGDGGNRKQLQKQRSKTDQKIWEENPDIYGIRRSSRQRKEPERLLFKSESDSDDSEAKHAKKDKRKRGKGWIPTLTDTESEDSDSSYDRPVRPQRKQRGGTQGRKQHGRTISSSSSDYVKTSKKKKAAAYTHIRRNATKEVSYKEDSDDATDSDDIVENDGAGAVEYPTEAVETIEKIMRHRSGRKGEIGAQTTIYAFEAEEIAAQGPADPAVDDVEVQFLIKWKGWSNLHNTWESNESLVIQKCDGMKKLDNYIKKMDEINKWKEVSTPEDVEYFEYQVEMNEEIQVQYQKVERIIAHQFTAESTSSYPDYYCKWGGLPYSDCTWEDGALTARFFQNEIDAYLERERSDLIPVKNAKCLRNRPKFIALKAQPTFLGKDELQLRDYQLDGLNWLVHSWHRETSVILADEMGLGKTIQSISFLSVLFFSHSLYGPFLIVVPLSTLDSWQREFTKWCPDMNVITYIGDVNSRTRIREYEWYLPKSKKIKFNALITTYEILLRDKDLLASLHWAVLIVDEAHRLKNEDSLLYRILIDFNTNFRLLVTGTPLQNSLKELWSLMHFIMPGTFEDWSYFETLYSISDKEGLQKLHHDLEPYLIRRVKKDVEKSLPAKKEQILRVEMSQVQKQYYKLILTKNVQELCKELKGSFSGLLNIIVELKKCCNHSCLIKPFEAAFEDPNYLQILINGSGKMILLDKLLCRLKETGHRVLIFSQMVRLLDIIADYLYLKKFQFQRLDGSIKGETRQRALDHFNAENSQDFCFLLSTRAGGLGINLASADTVIIFDSDWNPQNDLQAMARAHRIGQKKQVSIYRFVTKCTIEEDIIERAKKKMVLDHLIIQTMDTTGKRVLSNSSKTPYSNAPFNKEELSSILKFGAEELFKDCDDESDQKLQAMDIDEILHRAETQDTEGMQSGLGEDLLSQFKVVNYATFEEEEIKKEAPTAMEKLWEEIIPEAERKKAAEEMEKAKEEEVLKPRNRKPVTGGNRKKEVKSKEIVDTDSSSSSSESDIIDDLEAPKSKKAPAKKKIGNKALKKEGVKGFTDVEIRRFIKSFKKFARPLSRLDSIAEDAELMDKSTGELLEVGELLKSSCEQAVKEYQEKLLQDECFDGKKKGASIRIAGVTVNAPSVLKAEIEKEPLATALPQDQKDQLSYRLTVPTRNVHWGVQWGVVEDSMLLLGMLMYGVGNWDAIKNDPKLELSTKILPIGNGKPNDKHLNTRAEYLLKLLKEQCDDHDKMLTKKEKKKSVPEQKPKQASETPKVEKEEKGKKSAVPEDEKEKPEKKKKSPKVVAEKPPKKEKKEKKKKPKTPAALVDDAHAPGVIVEEVKLEEAIFRKCKEKMRAERKSLQSLQTPDESLSEKEQVQNTKRCLLKIGDHIEKCLDDYNNNPEDLNTWRNNLWSFVAKFTEFGPAKLHKLYRTACRKRDAVRDEHKREIQKLKESYSNSLHEMGKFLPHDRLEMEEARKRALGLNTNTPAAKIPKLDRIRIPHKKKESSTTENDQHYYGEASENYGDAPGNYGDNAHNDEYPRDYGRRDHHRSENWRGRGGGGGGGGGFHRGGNYHHDQRGRYRKPYRKHDNDDHHRWSHNTADENSGGKVQTYREWKESQNKHGAPYDEKPHHEVTSHGGSHGKIYHKDRPLPYRDEKNAAGHKNGANTLSDPREKTRGHTENNKNRHDDRQYGLDYTHTPSYLKSPDSSHPPVAESWSRKRTLSNNSDGSGGHSNKYSAGREPDHSPSSNHSWSTPTGGGGGGGDGNT